MLKIEGVGKRYGRLTVLENVSLAISPGASVSLIGESGSGKSTLSRLILALEKPTQGRIRWENEDIFTLPGKRLYRDIQPVFQDNAGCFNPRWRIGDSLCEPMKHLLTLDAEARSKRAQQLLEMVELPDSVMQRYPHELSGGQQKRVCIARALSIKPKLVILDEAVSGLDATVMVKILVLLKELQREIGCGYLFITHDIRAAMYMSETIAEMKDGRLAKQMNQLKGGNDEKDT